MQMYLSPLLEEAEEVVSEIEKLGRKATALYLDMAKLAERDSFVDEFKKVLQHTFNASQFDYLIHNAGQGATVPIENVTESIFDELLNVHFKGVYFLTQQLISSVRDKGSVIFISSGTTRFCVPGYSVYSSMKAAVEVFSKYVAKEYGARGIRANVVAPGPIETDFNNAAIRNNPQMKNFLSGLSPLGRVGNANDIGSVVAFLCSDDARWINAQRIEVSGGINM